MKCITLLSEVHDQIFIVDQNAFEFEINVPLINILQDEFDSFQEDLHDQRHINSRNTVPKGLQWAAYGAWLSSTI